MGLLESKRKLAEIQDYLRLNSLLEEIVRDEEETLLSFTKAYLEMRAQSYGKIVALEEEVIRMKARAEGRLAVVIQMLSEEYGLTYEEAKRRMKEEEQKSFKTNKRDYFFEIVKNTALAIISFPFSRKASSNYSGLAQTYASTIRILNETAKLSEEVRNKEQENLRRLGKLEQKQAVISSGLIADGFDERTADAISLNPDLSIYRVLDSLKNRYGLD